MTNFSIACSMKQGLAKYSAYALPVCSGGIILFFIFRKVPFAQVIEILRHSHIGFLCVSLAVASLSIFINAMRWKILLAHYAYHYSFAALSKFAFISLFFNTYLPAGVVGDFVRVHILSVDGVDENDSGFLNKIRTSVIVDRGIGLLGLFLLSLIGGFFCYRFLIKSKFTFAFFAIAFCVLSLLCILFSRRLQGRIKKCLSGNSKIITRIKAVFGNITEASLLYRNNYAVLVRAILLSIYSNLCVVIYFYLLAKSIHVQIPFLILLIFVPIIEFISAAPISIGGIGIRDAAVVMFFAAAGVPAPEALSISFLAFIIVLLTGGIGGILFLNWYGRRGKPSR